MEYAHTIRLDTKYCCPVNGYKYGDGANFGACMLFICVLNPLRDFDEMRRTQFDVLVRMRHLFKEQIT
jgi:hypothetical protein